MRVDDECFVVDAKVLFARDFDLHLPEALLDGGSAAVEIIVDVLDADNDELGEPVSAQNRLE